MFTKPVLRKRHINKSEVRTEMADLRETRLLKIHDLSLFIKTHAFFTEVGRLRLNSEPEGDS